MTSETPTSSAQRGVEQDLYGLLCRSFTVEELRRFAHFKTAFAQGLPESSSINEYAFAFVTAALRHNAVDEELFEALCVERPKRIAVTPSFEPVGWTGIVPDWRRGMVEGRS